MPALPATATDSQPNASTPALISLSDAEARERYVSRDTRTGQVIYTVDCVAGAGKTYAAVDHSARLAGLGRKTVIAQPSALLIDQTFDDFRARHPAVPVTQITSATHPNRVTSSIIAHCKAAALIAGEVLLITHSALMRLPYVHRKDDWTLIVDEAPSLTSAYEFSDIPANFRSWYQTSNADMAYCQIAPKWWNTGQLNAVVHLQAEAKLHRFREFAGAILNPWTDVFALKSQINRSAKGGQVAYYTMLRPEVFDGWNSATVMAACLTDTLLYRAFVRQGVEFRPHRTLMRGLRLDKHTNGNLLTIHHALTDVDWSKGRRDTVNDEATGGMTILDAYASAADRAVMHAECAVLVNKDAEHVLTRMVRPVQLPNSSHGLNTYQHIHNGVALSALNLTPGHCAFLQTREITSEEIRRAIYYAVTYQSVMRTSLRNPDDQHAKIVVVPDAGCAAYLSYLFPGSGVVPLASDIKQPKSKKGGRPKMPTGAASDAERKRASRERKRREREWDLQKLVSEWKSEVTKTPNTLGSFRDTSDLGFAGGPETSISLPMYRDQYSTEPMAHLDYTSHDEFIAYLRDQVWPISYGAKDDVPRFSASVFSRDQAAGHRGRDNVRYSALIILDNDGGDLSHADFADLFPDLRITVANSYSSTASKPKWRAILPVSALMTADVYGEITRQMMAVLHAAGYRDDKYLKRHPDCDLPCHGFDVTKIDAENLFNLPCQPADPSGVIWCDYNGPGRLPINVEAMVSNTILPTRLPEPVITLADIPVEVLRAAHDFQIPAETAVEDDIEPQRDTSAVDMMVILAKIRTIGNASRAA